MLLHYVSALLPAVAARAAPPWALLYDGHSAVYLFFLLSGAVLTPSFARAGGGLAGQVAKRGVRLFVPVAAATLIAAGLIAAVPRTHRLAAQITGSAWFAMDSSGAATPAHVLRELGLDSLLLGYREATLFPALARWLTPMDHSLDAPFWSLHVELYGSLLVLALVWLRRHGPAWHGAGVAASFAAFAAQPLALFVIGHLAARWMGRRAPSSLPGLAMLALGLALCAEKDWSSVDALRRGLDWMTLAGAPNLYQFQSQLGATVLFAAVLACPALWGLLTRLAGLGRLSFSLYLLHFPILFTVVSLVLVR
ncbi:MAG: acyltransferase family protein, partial [Rhodospirillales bacterium]|nr:acyltransferase family protein [Rhodospirillales bacterium]